MNISVSPSEPFSPCCKNFSVDLYQRELKLSVRSLCGAAPYRTQRRVTGKSPLLCNMRHWHKSSKKIHAVCCHTVGLYVYVHGLISECCKTLKRYKLCHSAFYAPWWRYSAAKCWCLKWVFLSSCGRLSKCLSVCWTNVCFTSYVYSSVSGKKTVNCVHLMGFRREVEVWSKGRGAHRVCQSIRTKLWDQVKR